MDMSMVLDMLLIAFGVYMSYAAVALKTRGEVTANIMLPKNVKPEQIKDKEGFIAFTYPKTLVIGIITVIMGLAMLVNDFFKASVLVNFIVPFFFMIVVIIYGVMIKKAQSRFL